jgi:hypothetical protein
MDKSEPEFARTGFLFSEHGIYSEFRGSHRRNRSPRWMEALARGSISSSGHREMGSRRRRGEGGADAAQQWCSRCSGGRKTETAPRARGLCRLARALTSLGPQGWSCRHWRPAQGAAEELAGRWLNCLTEEREHAEGLRLHSSWTRPPQKLRCLKRGKR